MSPKRPKPQKPINNALGLAPEDHAHLSATALSLHRAGRLDEAKLLYRRLLQAKPHDVSTAQLLSALLIQQRMMPEAISLMQTTLKQCPSDLDLLNNLGAALLTSGRISEAIETLDRALLVHAQDPTARKNRKIAEDRHRPSLAQRWHIRQASCDWTDRDIELRRIMDHKHGDDQILRPFLGLLVDDPEAQLEIAQRWALMHFSGRQRRYPASPHRRDKIRLGYFSSDFYNHAVMVVIAGMLERHDRQRFEIFGFSTGHHSDDEMRRRAQASMNGFVDVSGKPDEQIAALSRSMEIDIALDLGGHTQNARPGLFAYGAAPVQINFLGYSGTMGTTFHDYIVADHTVIPQSHQRFYSEKVITFAGSYLPTDNSRQISPEPGSRRDAGLPDGAFVFCCFNNAFKITPEVFRSWTNILRRVPTSVLWLHETTEDCKENLKREASSAQIDPQRLVFAQRVPSMASHLARQRLADLFLDTLPYNAHTTAGDALFAGLPVLTRIGESFASRVAASMNKTMGLDELITQSASEYEDRAVALAGNPSMIQRLKSQILRERDTARLFDTAAYTRQFEHALTMVHERYQSGMAPDHMYFSD
jgi:predicted O-linked N-acetylglucosamine transferase (SPINDLY family)